MKRTERYTPNQRHMVQVITSYTWLGAEVREFPVRVLLHHKVHSGACLWVDDVSINLRQKTSSVLSTGLKEINKVKVFLPLSVELMDREPEILEDDFHCGKHNAGSPTGKITPV